MVIDSNLLQEIAKRCHMANKVWCELNGDFSQVDWDELDLQTKESVLEGVLFVLDRYPDIKAEDLHINWLNKKISSGWEYGPIKDEDAKQHPSMVDYFLLSETDKIKDLIFLCTALTYLQIKNPLG